MLPGDATAGVGGPHGKTSRGGPRCSEVLAAMSETEAAGEVDEQPGLASRVWRAVSGGIGPFGLVLLVLAAVHPYVVLLDANRAELDPDGQVLGLAVLTLVVAFATCRLAVALLPRAAPDRVAAVVAVVLLWFFAFSSVLPEDLRLDHPAWAVALWGAAAAIGGTLVYRATRSAGVRQFLGIFVALLTLLPTAGYVLHRLERTPPARASGPADAQLLPDSVPDDEVDGLIRPNIYWFLPDEYARADQMAAVVGHDNTSMLDELRDRGFAIGDQTYASYPITALSVASVLAMDYPARSDADLVEGPFPHTAAIGGESAVTAELARLGYRTAYAEAGPFDWAACDPAVVDACIPPIRSGLALDELQSTVLDATPLSVLDLEGSLYTTPTDAVDALLDEVDLDDGPLFFMAHVLSPHHPYRFEAGCEPAGTSPPTIDRERYAIDVGCLNEQLLEAVDRILAVDPTAVIVIQSDHGTRFGLQGDVAWDDDQLWERFPVMDARRLPEGCELPTDRPTSTANTFRTVLGCIEGREFPLLEYRAFKIWCGELRSIEEFDPPW